MYTKQIRVDLRSGSLMEGAITLHCFLVSVYVYVQQQNTRLVTLKLFRTIESVDMATWIETPAASRVVLMPDSQICKCPRQPRFKRQRVQLIPLSLTVGIGSDILPYEA